MKDERGATAIQGGHTVEAEGIEIHVETLKKTTNDECSLKPKKDSGLLSKVKLSFFLTTHPDL